MPRAKKYWLMKTEPTVYSIRDLANEPKKTTCWDGVRNYQARNFMRDEMKPNYLTDGPNRGAILDLCMAMAMDLGAQVFVRQSHALMTRPDQQDTLRGYHGPSLVLCGRDDGLCPVERHELMFDLLPNATLQIIEQAGHLPTLENPTDTTAALIRWLEA